MKTRKTRVAINGFGQIGRQVARIISQQHQDSLELVAINHHASNRNGVVNPDEWVKINAHLFKYDSNHGAYPGDVQVAGDEIEIDVRLVKVLAESDPSNLPWSGLAVDLVLECVEEPSTCDTTAYHCAENEPLTVAGQASEPIGHVLHFPSLDEFPGMNVFDVRDYLRFWTVENSY